MYKVGDVYSTLVDGKKHHPVVIVYPKQEGIRIKAVGFSHDSNKNLEFDPKFIVEPNEQNGYTFRWEEFADGSKTSVMPKGFEKKIAYLYEKIGEIYPEGIEYILDNVHEFIECDETVKQHFRRK